MEHVDQFVADTIRDKCKNLNSIILIGGKTPVQLKGFRNLNELKVITNCIGNVEWRKIFADNDSLEILDYLTPNTKEYEEGFMELLTKLPKGSQSLGIPWFRHSFPPSQELEHLLRLDGLTKLSLRSFVNYNEILAKVAVKLNLVELNIVMRFNADSLGIIKSFRALDVLEMYFHLDFEEDWLSDATVFLPNLKRLKIDGVKISCSHFMSIVSYLKLVDTFDLGISGDIFLDQDKLIRLEDSKVISQIEDGLRRNRRTLKIISFDRNMKDSLLSCLQFAEMCSVIREKNTFIQYTHKSSHLTIISGLYVYQTILRSTHVDI